MNWELFYLICFVVGFAFTAISFVSGTLHVHFHVPGHGHFHLGHAGGGTHGGHFPLFNPMTIAVFLAWFGGAGYLLAHGHHIWIFAILIVASLAGLLGASIVFLFVAKFLMAHESELDPMDFEMVGVLGKVSGTIRQGGTGEIIFEQVGTRKACAARAEHPEQFSRGEEVIVTKFEHGVAYVRRWNELAGEAGIFGEEEKSSQ
jgi:membrane protein implicated in regulation of membrane protease activity